MIESLGNVETIWVWHSFSIEVIFKSFMANESLLVNLFDNSIPGISIYNWILNHIVSIKVSPFTRAVVLWNTRSFEDIVPISFKHVSSVGTLQHVILIDVAWSVFLIFLTCTNRPEFSLVVLLAAQDSQYVLTKVISEVNLIDFCQNSSCFGFALIR